MGVFRDITAERTEREQWVRQALHDDLTGLPNRRQLELRLGTAIAQSQASSKPFALRFVDLDGFKHVNDSLGHAAGDEVLRRIATRLRRVLRECDMVARVGGDEFAMLLESVDDETHVAEIHTRLSDLVHEPVPLDSACIHVGCSVGVSWFPQHGADPLSLFSHADSLMYANKRRRRAGPRGSSILHAGALIPVGA